MHLNFHFNLAQIFWALTFAALLVLLVVLLGKDRARRFPVFCSYIVLVTFRLLASRMLFGRLSPVASAVAFLSLDLVIRLLQVGVVVELARRAFRGASRKTWLTGSLVLLAGAGTLVGVWGPWPAWKTLMGNGLEVTLRLMQLVAERCGMLADALAVELAMVTAFAGRRFHAGWRSHAQKLVVGLSTWGATLLALRGIWQAIATHAIPHSQAEYERIIGLQEKLYNASSVIYLAVLVWWIAFLWCEEPGIPAVDSEQPPAAI